MALGQLNNISPGDFLETIKSCHPPLEPFSLTLYHEGENCTGGLQGLLSCHTAPDGTPCKENCPTAHEDAVRQAIRSGRPLVFRCPGGLLHFAVPFLRNATAAFCLLGSLRATDALDLPYTPTTDALEAPDPAWLGIESMVAEFHTRLPVLLQQNLHTYALARARREIGAVHNIGQAFDRCQSAEEILHALGESLIILLNLSATAIFISDREKRVSLQKVFGMPAPEMTTDERIAKIIDGLPRQILDAAELNDLFPGWQATQALCIPLRSGETSLGLVVLADGEGLLRDSTAAELLISNAADKLLRLRTEEDHRQESAVYQQLLAGMKALALAEDQEDICRTVLQAAADLVNATAGSLMLLEESGQNLFIEVAIGMNASLARSLVTPVGAGIAGKVFKSGAALLVHDIEKDLRIATPNRPRYQTKSFISLPLKAKDLVFGVLNLSDRTDKGGFTEANLHLLATFIDHAAIMVEKVRRLENASHLEALSVTDPLTGLYNRRFLERRMEEELSRSFRQKGSFSLLMLDLDNFKNYNDVCGHLSGDHALRKTAALLLKSAREMDVVTRFGGEEFCIILPGTGKEESLLVAERIRRAIDKEPFPQEIQLSNGSLTASVGIASYPEDGHTAISLIEAADQALYQAKSAGRNRVVLYRRSPEIQGQTA